MKPALNRQLPSWTHLRLAAALCVGVSALAMLPEGASAQDSTLVIARDIDINSLDPSRAWCDTCQIYMSNVYETLIGLDKDNKTLKPRLATKWEANADQSKFTFTLDPGAKFADGTPVEAKDVKWSMERLENIKGGASYMMDSVKSIDAKDAHTVVVTLSGPNSEFLNILTAPYTGVVNSKVASANGAIAAPGADTADKAESWFMQHSAGSGAYELVDYKPGEELRFKANPHYDRTKVGVADIVIKQTKDSVTQAQQLESGNVDVAMQIDPDTAKTIQADTVSVETIPSYNFLYVALSPGAKDGGKLLTKEVREAIGLALDYDGIIDFTVGGAGRKIASPIPNGFPGTDGLTLPQQNLEKAKELMKKAGHAEGFELNDAFPNMNVYGVDMSLLNQKIQQDLAKINIKVKLTPIEFSVWRDRVKSEGIALTTLFFAPDYYGSAQYVQYFGMIEGSPWWNRAGGKRDASFTNPQTETVLTKALSASEAQKDGIYKQLAQQMIDDRIIIPVVSPDLVLAHGKNITGVRYSACCNLMMDEIGRQ
ncbi:ABC transporter substrate-binding protein [Dongia soli]|uniref:ABC transporter substrate-binding protein n=1 Tax=Dongia soli TaxID=600628 RepID=A0ABU5EDW1_9PROT|nr:ABC transporter substrate-binding protein [Dongia soli]MDY0883638.1 ABC transporter substrate-binding protein [Dongia soli]